MDISLWFKISNPRMFRIWRENRKMQIFPLMSLILISLCFRRMSSEVAAVGTTSPGVGVEELEAAGRVELGEGPHWVDSEQALYFVDLLKGALHRLHPASGLHTHATPPGGGTLGFVVPVRMRPGLFVAGLARQLVLLQWDGKSDACRVVAPLGADAVAPDAAVRFNDGKADPTGRVWAGQSHAHFCLNFTYF